MQGPTHHQGTLGIATNFASRKEVVGDIFHDTKGKEKRQEDADEGGFGRNSKKKNKQSCREPLVAVAEHKKPRAPPEGGSGIFDKMLEKPCIYHRGPVKQTLKECGMMNRYLFEGA
jgi:hypothetical protein